MATDYSYDGVNRLSAATNVGNSALTRSFTYSPSGNLLSKSDVGTYSYPAPTAARPHAPTKAGSWTFSYDGNGNMVSGKGRTITYDGKDRPISVTMGGVTTQYVYGPDGARLKKISGGQTTLYLGTDEEILPDGTVIKHLDGSVRRVGTTTNWLHRDHLSSVRMLTNSAGDIAAVSRYQPYGKRTDVQQAADTPRESKGWIGERDDPETGLTYLNARYYDADLAQFLQADWLNPTHPYVGTNRYSYALNNPIAFKDPTGNYAIDDGELDAVVVYSDYDPCSGLCEGGYGYRGPGRDEDRNPTSRYKHVQIAQAKVLQLSVVPGYYPGVNLSQNQALAEFEQDFFDYIITNGPASHVMYGAAYLTYGSIYLQNQEVDANGKKKAQDPPVPGAKPGQKTKGRTQQWEKPGDFQDALKDYKDKNPEKVKSLPDGGEVGKLPDGRMINVRPYSSDNRPTIEIQDGKNRIKIRYGD
ncbi:RHS repeat domain-containing protein [Pseudovibrio denitrificans]|uniref:RHS repeat domain-containing protein n=1 Tax=Pseudovibrio denitrificans TaxID=258256 RepID=UPI0006D07E2A|nr:RHS repeat-associated core domain-containing protein [Pseudovibrio denitrificans]